MIEHQASHAEDIKKMKLSNDMRDVVLTHCRVCQEPINLTRMRGHTKSRHKMTITEYKKKFNQHYYDPISLVLHRCALCGEYLVLDSDVIAQHLRGNSKTHGKISHADYNKQFMKLRSFVKLEKKELEEEPFFNQTTDGPDDEKVKEFRDFIKELSTDRQFPALEGLLAINDFSPENVAEFFDNFRQFNI